MKNNTYTNNTIKNMEVNTMKTKMETLIKKYNLRTTIRNGEKCIYISFGEPTKSEIEFIKANKPEMMNLIEELESIARYNALHPDVIEFKVYDSDPWETLSIHSGYSYEVNNIVKNIMDENNLDTRCFDILYKFISKNTFDRFFNEYYVENPIEKGRWQEWYYNKLLELSKEGKAPGVIKIPFEVFVQYIIDIYDECDNEYRAKTIDGLKKKLESMGEYDNLPDTREEADKKRRIQYKFNCDCSDRELANFLDRYIYSKEDYNETLEKIAQLEGGTK